MHPKWLTEQLRNIKETDRELDRVIAVGAVVCKRGTLEVSTGEHLGTLGH
jgi:hypothetical protein